MKIKEVAIGDLCAVAQPQEFKGSLTDTVTRVQSLDEALASPESKQTLTWVNDKNIHKLDKATRPIGLLVCGEAIRQISLNSATNVMVVENPRLVFLKLLSRYYERFNAKGMESTVRAAPDVKIGADSYVGHHCILESNVVIGKNCNIGHNNVIKKDTVIADNVVIGCNNTIGGEGFGYEKNEEGWYTFMPHVGKVVIHEDVEIGNNVCIDRGVLSDTVIGRNAKIDNFVHVAHNVQVGENCLLIAHAMIGGSVRLGKNVWVGPSASIMNGLQIGNNVVIGLAAVVVKDLDDNVTVAGNPALPTEELRLWSSVRKKILKEYK